MLGLKARALSPTVTVWILTDGAVVDAGGVEVELVGEASGGEPPYWARAKGRESRTTAGERIIMDFRVRKVQV